MPFGSGALMDLINSPIGQLFMTMMGGNELQTQQDQFNADSKKTLDDILSGSQTLEKNLIAKTGTANNDTQKLIEDLANKTEGKYSSKNAELQAFLSNLGNKLNTDYTNRNKRVEDLLAGTNDQNIADINRSFDNRQETLSQNLINSGLSGGTTGIDPAGMLERDRGDTISSSRQNYASNLASMIADLEGQRIGSQRDIGFAQADFDRAFTGSQIDSDILLRGGGIDAQNQASQNMINLARDFGMFRFNTMQNVQRIPPQPGPLLQYAQQQGQNSQGTPDQPSAFESSLPAIIGGLALVLSGGAAAPAVLAGGATQAVQANNP